MTGLEKFIVAAKAASYVGSGKIAPSCRTDSHDLTYEDEEWSYLDSYFGGTDFLGQETVWRHGKAVWAMNYYGHIMRPDLIDAERAGRVIKYALTLLYKMDRFLGGFSAEWARFTIMTTRQEPTSGSMGSRRSPWKLS